MMTNRMAKAADREIERRVKDGIAAAADEIRRQAAVFPHHGVTLLSAGKPDWYQLASKSIKQHEGFVPGPYLDSLGNWTQGYGRLMQVMKDGYPALILTEAEASALMDVELREAFHDCAEMFRGFGLLDTQRAAVLVEMRYQLGRAGLAGFVKMRAAVERGDWAGAKREMLDSKWAEQTPSRTQELAQLMEDGDGYAG